jgi:hypothetical protein
MATNGKAVMENVRRYRALASGKLQPSVPFRGTLWPENDA